MLLPAYGCETILTVEAAIRKSEQAPPKPKPETVNLVEFCCTSDPLARERDESSDSCVPWARQA